MKSVKKIIAALSAATMVSACAGVVASADEAVNAVNVSYSTAVCCGNHTVHSQQVCGCVQRDVRC